MNNVLTVREAAEMLGVSTQTVRRLIADGRLRQIDLGRRVVRIRRVDVERLVTA